MSHVDAARGFRWVKSLHGGKSAPPMIDVVIPASTTLYRGCMVVCSVAGVLKLPEAAIFETAVTTTLLMGIAPGYLPAQSSAVHFSLINPIDQVFEVQLGNSTTAMDTLAELNIAISQGTQFGFLAGASAVSGLNQSATELNLGATGTTVGTHVLQIVGYPERQDNQIEATTGDLKGWVRFVPASIAAALRA